MAIPILHFWEKYFYNFDEGLGSTYERFIINEILYKTVENFRVKKVLEVPSFGFTGLSGINSMGLVKQSCDVCIIDSDKKRISLAEDIWSRYDFEGAYEFKHLDLFEELPFGNMSFDMSWNFSALWFVKNINNFLGELSRVTKKVIVLMVPNRTGLGYLHQKYTGKNDLKMLLNEDFIKPNVFIPIMMENGWNLLSDNYLDCPLWPDIGMSKEDFLKKFTGKIPFIETVITPLLSKEDKSHNPVTILDYYSDTDIKMEEVMRKYRFFEDYAPAIFKAVWAHHHYYIFTRDYDK